MNVLVPRLSGFCPGVKNAEKQILTQIKQEPNYHYSVLGMMINNKNYIKYLESINVYTINYLKEAKPNTIIFIRTHGIDRFFQKEIESNFETIDLTCRNVKRVQEIIKKHSDNNAMIFITGKINHPETIGLKSYAKDAIIFETIKDVELFLKNPTINGNVFNPHKYLEIFITSQTTGDKNIFSFCKNKIKEKWPQVTINSFNSICPITEKKEKEALLLQKQANISIVIGDTLSSNANKLFNILKNGDDNTFFVQDKKELEKLKIDFSNNKTALVVSSASTPSFIENDIVSLLKSIT